MKIFNLLAILSFVKIPCFKNEIVPVFEYFFGTVIHIFKFAFISNNYKNTFGQQWTLSQQFKSNLRDEKSI